MKKVLGILLIVALATVIIYYRYFLLAWLKKDFLDVVQNSVVVQNIQKDISLPDPLRSAKDYSQSHLTKAGVITWTNQQRNDNGSLPALKENTKLDQAATNKMNDMFKNQYFEHVSPNGKGPSELAADVNYEFIAIGENLALGNFKDDQDLVNAWMNSPGHRANILNKKFEEIGVAVGQGMYEGKKVWIAVQEFGKPTSSCPAVDLLLRYKMDVLKKDVNTLESQLKETKQELENANPQTKEEYDSYNQKVADYNALVKIYNNKIDQLKVLTDTYNSQVQTFNTCAQQ